MTILNETTALIQEGYTWGFELSFSSVFLLISGIIIIALCSYIMDKNEDIGIIILIILFFGFGILVLTSAFHSKPVYKEVPQYEVIFDDEASFQEIYNKYDIIEQRGQIFVLQEKNQNNGQ